eukprot:TRINITY_DN48721_c0_g1_i1.p4 TRINITY_DN48721_c0_g1~~TRINITY_DN48721_c0_g1_i1.p4  ORF type:complete len:108 (+),score=30.07 TRINITY_DN48721_c0_g1_i1:173-496(+)
MQRGLVGSEMCIRDRYQRRVHGHSEQGRKMGSRGMKKVKSRGTGAECKKRVGRERIRIGWEGATEQTEKWLENRVQNVGCLLYTSDAADDTPCVDLGGRRTINKKNE